MNEYLTTPQHKQKSAIRCQTNGYFGKIFQHFTDKDRSHTNHTHRQMLVPLGDATHQGNTSAHQISKQHPEVLLDEREMVDIVSSLGNAATLELFGNHSPETLERLLQLGPKAHGQHSVLV